jgi:hypothetical protein
LARDIVTVDGSVSDSVGNSLGADDTWSYDRAPIPPGTTNADFDRYEHLYIDNIGDGVLRQGRPLMSFLATACRLAGPPTHGAGGHGHVVVC